jgi:hypothetical protein
VEEAKVPTLEIKLDNRNMPDAVLQGQEATEIKEDGNDKRTGRKGSGKGSSIETGWLRINARRIKGKGSTIYRQNFTASKPTTA